MSINIPKISSAKIYKYNSKNKTKNPIEYDLSQDSSKHILFKGIGLSALKIKTQEIKERKFSRDFFLAKGKPSSEECKDIILNHPNTVVKAYKIAENIYKQLEQNPNITAKAANSLKEYLDKNIDNYEIVSIGTSPSAISEAMEHLGCNVIYLPASGLRQVAYPGLITKIMNNKQENNSDGVKRNLKLILEYFKSKTVNNNNKTYILLDYCCSGRTQQAINELLKEFSGIEKDKIITGNLIELLKAANSETDYNKNQNKYLSESEIEKITNDCTKQRVELITNVPHFDINDRKNRIAIMSGDYSFISSNCKTKKKVFEEFDNYSTEEARAYSLCTYNELYKLGLV